MTPPPGPGPPPGTCSRPLAGFPPTLLRDGRVLVGDVDEPDDAILRRRGVRPGQRDLDRHREDPVRAFAVRRWHGHGAPRRQGPGGRRQRPQAVRPRQRDLDRHREDDHTPLHSRGHADVRRQGARGGRRRLLGAASPCTDSAEVYDPDTGSWTAIANMQAPHFGPTAAILQPDGKVLVVGIPEATAELSVSCTTRPREPGPRSSTCAPAGVGSATATLLSDGTLLLALPI